VLLRTTTLCRCGAAYTDGLRACHAVPKGMLPRIRTQGHLKESNDRRDSGGHVAGGGSDRHGVSATQMQTHGARHRQAYRGNDRGKGGPRCGGAKDSSKGRQDHGAVALPSNEWLHMVRDLCAQQAPETGALFRAMSALGEVHSGELQLETRVERVLDSMKALLSHGRHDGGADDVRLLFAASKAVTRHSMLWARASCALNPAVAALMDPCARSDAMYKDNVLVSQMAVLQPRLQYMCQTFWQALARHGTTALDARGTANTFNAYAKLISQQQGAFMPRTGNSLRTQSVLQAPHGDRLHDVLCAAAEREAPRMNSQGVANTVGALAKLDMPPTGSLREALLKATERVVPSMNSQGVANTVGALAKLDMPPTGSLRKELLKATEREAPSMNSQEVANTVGALAKLDMPPSGNLREALLKAAEREAPRMNSQEVANTVWALAKLDMPPTGSLRKELLKATERVTPTMMSHEVATTLWALAALDMPPTGSLRNALWAAAERVAPTMDSPALAVTMWALAKLEMAPTGSLHDCLLAAAERVAPSMNLQEVTKTLWALAMLDMPPTGSLRDALWAAAERAAPTMNSQQVAMSLFAITFFHIHDTSSSRQVTERLFERAAQLNENLSLEDKRQVRQVLDPVCLSDMSACGTKTSALAN
jgi:hypothetical protein